MTRVVARIQHHPSRHELIRPLVESLRPLSTVVSPHSSDPPSPWAGYRVALQSGISDPTEPSHVLLLQDDVLVCENFVPALHRLLEAVPANPVCLFYPGLKMRSRRALQLAVSQDRSLFRLDRHDFVPVVAVVWPIEKARKFLSWTDGRKIPGLHAPYRSDDAVAGAWMRLTREDVYVTLPSIVQHPDTAGSVKGGSHKPAAGRDKGRVAFSFCEDARDLEWRI